MSENRKPPARKHNPDEHFRRCVRSREKSTLRSRDAGPQDVWFGLGMFGLVGWSVAVPTLLGVFLGLWIDMRRPGPRSWTLMLLLLGLCLGCANAWFWVERQRKGITREKDSHGD